MPRPARTKILHYLRVVRAAEATTTPEQLDAALDAIMNLVAAERGLIVVPDAATGLRVLSGRRLGQNTLNEGSKWASRTLYGWVLENNEVRLASPLAFDPVLRDAPSLSGAGRSAIVAPFAEGETVHGVLMLFEENRAGWFDEEDRNAVELLLRDTTRLVAARLAAERDGEAPPTTFHGLVGETPAMRKLFATLEKLARSPSCVLIEGERGSGKELVARALHRAGPRKNAPFVAVNSALLTPTLMETTLFGSVRGGFTGAENSPGLLEEAGEGTAFLDEIGELTYELQAKLLRLIQERTFLPVGARKEKKLRARIVTATNRDLAAEVANGRFRPDLYDRLETFRVSTPPLNERRADIPVLIAHLLPRLAAAELRPVPFLSPQTRAELARRDWSGNVRELENVLRRFVVLGTDGQPRQPRRNGRAISREEIQAEIERAGGNRSQAARNLDMPRSTFYRRLSEAPLGESPDPDA